MPTRSHELAGYFVNIQSFLHTQVCGEARTQGDYLAGVRRLDFHERWIEQPTSITVEDPTSHFPKRDFEYEESLLERLTAPDGDGVLLLLGGIGSGKSTTCRFIKHRIEQRRAAFQVGCGCSGRGCDRSPFYFDCNEFDAAAGPQVVIGTLMSRLRLDIYKRLLKNWLSEAGLVEAEVEAIDPDLVVLRRVLLATDVLGAADQALSKQLPTEPLRLSAPLLSSRPTLASLKQLVDEKRTPSSELDQCLKNAQREPGDSIALTAKSLDLYLRNCSHRNPLNLLIVDNLDPLPSKSILQIVEWINQLAHRVRKLAVLVPLRPTSLATPAYTRQLVCRYHFGPNNFALVLRRLERLVLEKSRADLMASVGGDSAVFANAPSPKEIECLLAASYLYALIALAGLERAENPAQSLSVHPDHRKFEALSLRGSIARSLAATVDALAGTCSRYALDELMRYFENIYHGSELFERLGVLEPEFVPVRPLPSYGHFVQTLVAYPQGPGERGQRLTNLFLPTMQSGNSGWPSMVKPRVLEELIQQPRVRLKSLLTVLSRYGIPEPVAVEALGDLRNSYRLLIWLSDNQEIVLPESLSDYVVLSEHGKAYFDRIVGEFEYLWHCGAEITGGALATRRLGFEEKLRVYTEMLDRLRVLEMLEALFFRIADGQGRTGSGLMAGLPLVTLSIAYCSLERAYTSVEFALGKDAASPEFKVRLGTGVAQLCEAISRLQRDYEVMYQGPWYLSRYSHQLARAQDACTRLLNRNVLAPPAAERLRALADGWRGETVNSLMRVKEVDEPLLAPFYRPSLDRSELVRSAPVVKDIAAALDARVRFERSLVEFEAQRERLSTLLRTSVPTPSQLDHHLGRLKWRCEMALQDARSQASTLESFVNVLGSQLETLDRLNEQINAAKFKVDDPVEADEMSALKVRANSYWEATSRLAMFLGAGEDDVAHLNWRWGI